MYGLISQLHAVADKRDELTAILLRGAADMPGCKQYTVCADTADDTGVWITEVWESLEKHQASLKLPAVRAAIAEGKPLIAGFGQRHVVTPLGGVGLE